MTGPSYLHSTNPRVAKAAFPFRHSYPVQVRFSDIDMLGHVNNNVYLSMFDLAKINYFHTLIGRPVAVPDLCMVVAHIDCDFLAPSFLGDDLKVWTQVTYIGEKSLKLEQRLVNNATGEVNCIARTVMVGYDPANLIVAPLRPDIVELMEKFEQHNLRSNNDD
ncbi:MAG: acyl-CoA thioesterase [Firmicutes bacterium]|nr:acyl-CoA thioesterase [Bacillota bacterium]MCM1400571.1 acyl-CoA thioesterase [Bacteroides sp.]MCM1476475.1 acyl-CoA thioesterase [Bacteroides sp.]